MSVHTIFLKGPGYHDEFVAYAALSPGHALVRDANNKVLKAAIEGRAWERLVAKEDALQGKTTADAFSASDIVPVHVGAPGTVVQMLFLAGVSYAITDLLILDAAGRVKKASAVTSGVTIVQNVGYPEAALDLSASGAVDTLGAVRLL